MAGAGTPAAPERVPHGTGHHEASWRHPDGDRFAGTGHRPLPSTGPDGRARQVRFAVPRRLHWLLHGDIGSASLRHPGAHRPALRPGHRYRPDRADRHGLHHLQPALLPGPALCLGGSDQRRPGRMEHCHLRRPGEAPELQPADRPAHAERYERAGGIPGDGQGAVGQLGRRRRARGQGGRDLGQHPARSTRSTTTAGISGQGPAERAAPRPGPPPAGPGRFLARPARTLPPATPRRCSRPSRRCPTHSASMPT